MATAFWVELRAEKYDSILGWHCPALTLPGASAEKIIVGGEEKPISHFQIDAAQIRFAGSAPASISNAAAKIVLSKRLVPVDTAIVVAILGLLGTIASAWVSYRVGMAKLSPAEVSSSDKIATPPASQRSSTTPPDAGLTEEEKTRSDKIRISFPRGYHAIIDAYGAHELEELRRRGIRIDDIQEGLRRTYVAMMKKTPDECKPIEWPLDGDGKPKDIKKYSYIEIRFDCEGSGDPRYSSFDLFQRNDSFKIYFEASGKKFGPIKSSAMGIDWEAARSGLRKALLALHKDSVSVEFFDMELYQEDDGKWGYNLPFKVRSLQ